MSPHSIAKSAAKPIFSPLPHPTFFAPKSPFFPLFSVSNPISGDFSRDSARFLPCEAHFLLVFPRFKSDFGRFFEESNSVFPRSTVYFLSHSPILNPNSRDFPMARHSFQPRTSISLRSVLYFPILRALLREISPFIIATLLFSHSVKAFSFRASLSPPSSTFLFSIDSLSAPHSPHPLHYSPTFFLFPPHFFNTFPNKRTNARTLAHYARTRTLAPTRTSGGFRLLPSPLHPPLSIHWAPTR